MNEHGTRRVLLADDNDEIRELLQRALQLKGYVVKAVSSGGEAISAWEEARDAGRPYCAMLIDIAMPDITGFQVTEYVRSHQRGNGVPVVLITAYDEPLVKAHANRSQADDVLYKPLDIDSLMTKVEALCEVKMLLDGVAQKVGRGESVGPAEEAAIRAVVENRNFSPVRRVAASHVLSSLETLDWGQSIADRVRARNDLFHA